MVYQTIPAALMFNTLYWVVSFLGSSWLAGILHKDMSEIYVLGVKP